MAGCSAFLRRSLSAASSPRGVSRQSRPIGTVLGKACLSISVASVLLLAGWTDPGMSNTYATGGRPVAVGIRVGSPIQLTAPVNGSNLDYSGVAQDFSAPGVIAALRDYRGGTIRYPGGAIANYWDWQKGSVDQPATTSGTGEPVPARIHDYGFTLQTLQRIVQESGTTPVFDLNLLTSTLADQLQMLRAAQRLGIPVRYVELGNEFYLNFGTYSKVFPTATSYARTVAHWAPAIHAAFPDAQIAAVGSLPQATARERSWNRTLLSIAGTDINAVTLHDYFGPSGKHPDPAQVLSIAQTSWRSTQHVMAAIPGRYRIWFTEFNMSLQGRSGGEPPRGATWIHGLYVAELMALFDQSPRVQLNDYWDLFSNPSTGAFTSGRAPQPTVAGTALMFLTNASAEASRVIPLDFTGAPALPGGAAGIIGLSFDGRNGRRTVLINLTDQPATFPTDPAAGLSPGDSTVSVSAAPVATVSRLTHTAGLLGRMITLPAYAIVGVGFTAPSL